MELRNKTGCCYITLREERLGETPTDLIQPPLTALHFHFPLYLSALPFPLSVTSASDLLELFQSVCHNRFFSHTHWTLSKTHDRFLSNKLFFCFFASALTGWQSDFDP